MKTLSLFLIGSLLWAGHSLAAQSNDDVAIIIGNRSYADRDIPKVSFAHNDARAMRLFAVNVLNIRQENILYLEDATQAQMQSAFGRKGNHRGKAFQYVKPGQSNLYVFYSGHGIPGLNEPKNFLLPVDAEIETAEINGYPLDVLYENLMRIDARSVTVFLDACFSGSSHAGTLLKQASGAQILPQTPTDVAQSSDTRLTVVTAASNDQLASWDEENKHGLFTEYLLQALYGKADQNGDAKIELAEVSAYLNSEMRYKARRAFNREQIPTVIGDKDQILVRAKDGTFPERPKALPSDLFVSFLDLTLEPVEQQMYALKNTNVRRAPNVKSEKLGVLPEGSVVNVIAKLTEDPWYAIERDQEFIGYVYQPLLGEKPERSDLSALEQRLAALEARTILGDRNARLPEPPESDPPPIKSAPPEAPAVREETRILAPRPPREDQDQNLNLNIEHLLQEMSRLLARQNFTNSLSDGRAQTALKYNWVRPDAARCRLTASVSFLHDKTVNAARSGDRIAIFDRFIKADFNRNYESSNRILKIRDEASQVVQETLLYRYGPFRFKNEDEMNAFIAAAQKLSQACVSSQTTHTDPLHKPPDDIIGAVRRPPPPPRLHKPY